jgi:hypothetical protein
MLILQSNHSAEKNDPEFKAAVKQNYQLWKDGYFEPAKEIKTK